jgi:hypothetical protein
VENLRRSTDQNCGVRSAQASRSDDRHRLGLHPKPRRRKSKNFPNEVGGWSSRRGGKTESAGAGKRKARAKATATTQPRTMQEAPDDPVGGSRRRFGGLRASFPSRSTREAPYAPRMVTRLTAPDFRSRPPAGCPGSSDVGLSYWQRRGWCEWNVRCVPVCL